MHLLLAACWRFWAFYQTISTEREKFCKVSNSDHEYWTILCLSFGDLETYDKPAGQICKNKRTKTFNQLNLDLKSKTIPKLASKMNLRERTRKEALDARIWLVLLVSESLHCCNTKGGLDSISTNTRVVREMCFQLHPGGYRTAEEFFKKCLIYLVLSSNSAVRIDSESISSLL